jgi:hypothetical protein
MRSNEFQRFSKIFKDFQSRDKLEPRKSQKIPDIPDIIPAINGLHPAPQQASKKPLGPRCPNAPVYASEKSI